MDGIRVNSSIKKIKVNENGDYITINFSDVSFPDRFYVMLENIQNRAADLQGQAKEISEKCGDNKEALDRQITALDRQFHEGIVQEVDEMFGENTCRKIFGDIVPSIDLFYDFFSQLIPYFEEYGKERVAKLSKYSAARTGNV